MADLIAVADTFTLNEDRPQDQTDARIVELPDGGFVAVWRDNLSASGTPGSYYLNAQRYDASGAQVGEEFRIDSLAGGTPFNHSVVGLANGSFVVAWEDLTTSTIRARVFTAEGIASGNEFVLASGARYDVSLSALPNGGFVATWSDGTAGGSSTGVEVRGQFYSATGATVGPVLSLNGTTSGFQGASDVVATANGGFIVVWQDGSGVGGDSSSFGIKARIFDSSGQPVGAEFLVNSKTDGNQGSAEITLLDNGGFIVTWVDSTNGGPGVVKARIFDSTGTALGAEFFVSAAPGTDEALPTVIAVDGGFLVSWSEGIGSGNANVYAQLFGNDGSRLGSEIVVNTNTFGNQNSPTLAVLSSGQVVVSWTDDNGTAASGQVINDVEARILYNPAQVQSGGTGNDTLNGTASGDVISGLAGNDTLNGNGGGDILVGGAGNDVLNGGAGNDRIYYDAADTASQVSGGDGTDTLVVEGVAAPTGFNLAAQGFEAAEVTQWDNSGGNPWSSIVQRYNVNWQLTEQVTNNDNGTRIGIQFDPLNQSSTFQIWNSFDSQNRLSYVDQLFDNGTRNFINLDETNTQDFAQNWFTYDAQNRLDTQDVHYDNGTRTFINFDQAANQAFTQDWFTYDAQGRLDTQDVYYDNGTRTFINFDQAGSQNFTQNWFTYDAQGRLDSQDVYYDNGTRTFINFDQDNSQPWSAAWFTYDAQGRLDTQDVFGDDGSRTFYNYDQDNTQPFQVSAILYNPSGVAYQQVTTWDDGSVTYTNL